VYQSTDTIVTEKKDWYGIYLKPGGEIVFSLVFETPKNKEKLVLRGIHSFFFWEMLMEIRELESNSSYNL
jgi:hypothetical protein